jgi:hypothetical protein
MPVQMTFQGTLYYTDERALRKALSDARARLGELDPVLAKRVEAHWKSFFAPDALALQVELSVKGPAGQFAALESLIRTLAERANDGDVEGSGGGAKAEPVHIHARMASDEES